MARLAVAALRWRSQGLPVLAAAGASWLGLPARACCPHPSRSLMVEQASSIERVSRVSSQAEKFAGAGWFKAATAGSSSGRLPPHLAAQAQQVQHKANALLGLPDVARRLLTTAAMSDCTLPCGCAAACWRAGDIAAAPPPGCCPCCSGCCACCCACCACCCTCCANMAARSSGETELARTFARRGMARRKTRPPDRPRPVPPTPSTAACSAVAGASNRCLLIASMPAGRAVDAHPAYGRSSQQARVARRASSPGCPPCLP